MDARVWELEARVWERLSTSGRKELRTAHVLIEMPAPVPRTSAQAVAHLAELHVEHLFARFGQALDLWMPSTPLRVVLHVHREPSFVEALSSAAPDHPGWGAFYDPRRGVVHVCAEPASLGALPLEADLRHEMAHQILDLSAPSVGRERIFRGRYLWLWEGFAAWTEGLGDLPGQDTRALRRQRYRARRARGEVLGLPALFRLDQAQFEGRHYDQSAVVVGFLLADGVPGSRKAALATLRDVLRGRARAGDLERGIGMDAAALARQWQHAEGGGS